MGDQTRDSSSRSSQGSEADQRAEPVRSRWTPKPEQILILESIFNSGMVNPPKDETVRIRKLLEEFGSVGDANVFYWFQNRRSRSRRRQRQIQASLVGGDQSSIQYESAVSGGTSSNYNQLPYQMNAASCFTGSGSGSSSNLSYGMGGSGSDGGSDGFYGYSGRHGLHELDQNSVYGSSDTSSLHYQPGVITVFINGVATEVGSGPLDTKAMFGGDFVLFHSSGVPVPVNEYGFLVQSLQHGESYFLVPKHS